MASNLDNPSQWRLRTATGIPYKTISMEGDFQDENGSVMLSILVQSNQLIPLLEELFPPPRQFGNLFFPRGSALPETNLLAKRAKFKSFDDELPINPFGADSGAPSGTYFSTIQVDIEYGTRERQEPDEDDPFTFLEISGNGSGDFISTPAPNAKWQLEECNTNDTDDETGEPLGTILLGDKERNTNPMSPTTVRVPTTEWNVKWKQIPQSHFEDVIIHRLRFLLGKVNSEEIGLIFDAKPETVLFDSFNYRQTFTWRAGNINAPPVSVDLKFIEKRVDIGCKIVGHNHFWRPEKGEFQKLLANGTDPVYELEDMNFLFQV